MTITIAGALLIGTEMIFAPIIGKIIVAGLHLGGGWLLFYLLGYGTVYGVVAGLGLIGIVAVELGHRARHSR